MTTRPVVLEVGTVVRLQRSVQSRWGGAATVVPAGSVGRVLGECPPAPGDEGPSYEVAVLLGGDDNRTEEQKRPDVEVVLSIPHASLQRLGGADALVERMRHPTLQRDGRLVEALRVCWSCGGTHALRYEVQDQLPSVAKDYDCPYCSARQEERAPFARGLDVQPAVLPMSRPGRR